MKQEMTASENEAFNNPEIRRKWFQAVKERVKWEDYRAMNDFKREYPEHFKFYSKVSRLRSEMKKDIEAMETTGGEVYFGTLTFNNAKHRNKIETKRKEAFEKLKMLFKYVLLVEEYGGVNGRYHIHFFGSFVKDHSFNEFKSFWHSRQNLEKVSDNNAAKYLASYSVKDLPRLHRNTLLVALKRKYKALKHEEFMTEVYHTPREDVVRAYENVMEFDDFCEKTLVKPIV